MASVSVSDSKKRGRQDLTAASSWRNFETLLLTHAPPVAPCPSPASPRSPFSFLSPARQDDTISHLPSADFHLYGANPISRYNPLVLCAQCGQPVPPHALARHFDHSHATPPPSPEPLRQDTAPPPVPLCLPLQPSHKLNNPAPDRHKTKHSKQKPARPRVSPVPQHEGLAVSKRFPSFLSDSPLPLKAPRLDPIQQTHKNPSFSFYTPSLPPALPFKHLPLLPRLLAFGPLSSGPRLTPSGLLLTDRSADRMHYALSQLLAPSEAPS